MWRRVSVAAGRLRRVRPLSDLSPLSFHCHLLDIAIKAVRRSSAAGRSAAGSAACGEGDVALFVHVFEHNLADVAQPRELLEGLGLLVGCSAVSAVRLRRPLALVPCQPPQ